MCIFIIILLYASITVFQRKPVSRRSYYGKTRVFRVILLLPIEMGRIIFLPVDRCGEGDAAPDVEVVGESAAVYLFGQAVVAGREVEQADMAIDGGGAVGGYGAQDGGEAEVLGEWNLLPVAVSLALDGVHWSLPQCCRSAVLHLPPSAVPLDGKRRMLGWQTGGREVLLVSSFSKLFSLFSP